MTQRADVTKVTKIPLAANVTERDVTWAGTGEAFTVRGGEGIINGEMDRKVAKTQRNSIEREIMLNMDRL